MFRTMTLFSKRLCISVIEYLMEIRYFYDAKEKLLQAEKELIKSISILLKFQL